MPTQDVKLNVKAGFDSSSANKSVKALQDQLKKLGTTSAKTGAVFKGMGNALARVNPVALVAVASFKLIGSAIRGLISLVGKFVRAMLKVGKSLLDTDKNIRIFNASLMNVQRAGGETGASFDQLNDAFTTISLATGKYRKDLVDLATKLIGVGAGQKDIISALIAASNASDALGVSYRRVGEAIFTAENVSTRSLSKLGVNVSGLTQEFLSQEGAIKLITDQFGDQVVHLKSVSLYAERIGNAFTIAKEVVLEVVLGSEKLRGFMAGVLGSVLSFVQQLRESPKLVEEIAGVVQSIVDVFISLFKLIPDLIVIVSDLAIGAINRYTKEYTKLEKRAKESTQELGEKLGDSLAGQFVPGIKGATDLLKLYGKSTEEFEKQERRAKTLLDLRGKIVKLQELAETFTLNIQTGNGEGVLKDFQDFINDKIKSITDSLNNDTKFQEKNAGDQLASLDSLARTIELANNELGFKIADDLQQGFETTQETFGRVSEGFESLDLPTIADQEKLFGGFFGDIADTLTERTDEIAEAYKVEADRLADDFNSTIAKNGIRREELQKALIKNNKDNLKRQLNATTQAERDQIAHDAMIEAQRITRELDLLGKADGLAKENFENLIAALDEDTGGQIGEAKAAADKASKNAAAQLKNDIQFNKTVVGALGQMGAALSGLATDAEITKEVNKQQLEFNKMAQETDDASVKAFEDLGKAQAKEDEKTQKELDKLQAERDKQLREITNDRNRELSAALESIGSGSSGEDPAKVQADAEKRLDEITAASEERRNELLEQYQQNVNQSEASRNESFNEALAAADEAEKERRKELDEGFKAAQEQADLVQKEAQEAARMAGAEFGDSAIVLAGELLVTAFQDKIEKSLEGTFEESFEALAPAVGGLVAPLFELLKVSPDKLEEFINGIVDSAVDFLISLNSKIPTIIVTFIRAIIKNIPKLIQSGIDSIPLLIEAIVTAIPSVAIALVNTIIDVVNRIPLVNLDKIDDPFAKGVTTTLDADSKVQSKAVGEASSAARSRNAPRVSRSRTPEPFGRFTRERVPANFSGSEGQRLLVAALNQQIEELKRNNENLEMNTNALATGFADSEFGVPPQLRPGFRSAREAFNPYLDPSSAPGGGGADVKLQIQIGDQKLRDILVNLQESGYTQVAGVF